jgi:SAM-dependent methyltransferase
MKGVDPLEFYETEGAAVRARIEDMLPAGWGFGGKRVLDFGCGSARVIRHFLDEASSGTEVWGCDIDGPSIEWVNANLCPPLHCFRNDAAPPLPRPDGFFDLVWATSVFTHITDEWSRWLVELSRVLAPDGLLIATFLGEGIYDALAGEPYVEDAVGMAVTRHWQEGPWVFHSEWWLREHWGRAFDVLAVRRPPRGPGGEPEITHSYIALRRRAQTPTAAELERIDAGDPREVAGLQTNLRLLRGELDEMVAERTRAAAAGPPKRAARLRRLVGR